MRLEYGNGEKLIDMGEREKSGHEVSMVKYKLLLALRQLEIISSKEFWDGEMAMKWEVYELRQ